MAHPDIERLRSIKTFPSLVKYLRDELDWPIESDDVEDLTFEYEAEELGIDPRTAAKIQEIKQLRPMDTKQPWGIFFVKFEPKRLPVVVLRKILNQLVIKKRASAGKSTQAAWNLHDLLFISSYGEQEERQITFAHFTQDPAGKDLPTLKVLGWDGRDTALHVDKVVQTLKTNFRWPRTFNVDQVRERWSSAFEYRHREVINTASELAERLAALASRIRGQVLTVMAYETEKGPIRQLHAAFRAALVHDLEPDGFADMYAQTIAYGLLSARIADPTKTTLDDFAAHMRTNPFLRELMETFLRIGGRKGKAGGPGIDFDELGVSDVVALLDEANMEAVVRDFGDRNPTEDPVIHFYEHFLAAYDKQLKVSRGVFYTPQPVVSYIVRSVHELLQTEFGLEDGLADTTTWGEMLKKHPGLKLPPLTDEPSEKRTISPDEPFVQILDPATGTATFLVEVIEVIYQTLQTKWKKQRLTEIQQSAAWNEYVPKHLLPRLHGYELMMAPYAIAHMKIGLKLTESGYSFGADERARIFLTNALEPWTKQPTLIGFDALAHEAAAVNEIKREKRFTVVIGNPPYSNFGQLNKNPFILTLLEDYKRDLKEKKLNLDDDFIKFMRFSQYLIDNTSVGLLGIISNHVFIDGITHRRMRECLRSSFSRIRVLDLHGNIKKQEVSPDGSKDINVFEIQQGVSISLFSNAVINNHPVLFHAELWGSREEKYNFLSRSNAIKQHWASLKFSQPNFFFVPKCLDGIEGYSKNPSLIDLFRFTGQGIQTKQDDFALQDSRRDLIRVVNDLKELSINQLILKYSVPEMTPSWSLHWAKRDVSENKGKPIKINVKPFDSKWTYFTGNSNGFLARPRRESTDRMLFDNIALVAKRQTKESEFSSIYVVNTPINEGVFSIDPKGRESVFPLHAQPPSDGQLFGFDAGSTSNLNRESLSGHFQQESDVDIFHFAYAVFHSPGYRRRYAEFLKIDFPRLPLTGNLELFKALAKFGGELSALHLLESPKLTQLITEFIGGRHPEMEKVSWSANTIWIDKAKSIGFKGVPEDIWNFRIGGYQVCEKWLKDRKGRVLSEDDIAHYQKIVVALSETIRLMAEIDEVIDAHGGWPSAFVTGE